MAGGPDEAVAIVQPVLETLAPKDGWAHVGPSGAGHFVKMVHNGIEYGLMQAYAEGFEVLKSPSSASTCEEIAGIWRYGSVVRSWLLELLHDAFDQHGGDLKDIARLRRRLGRGPLDDLRGDHEDVPVPVIRPRSTRASPRARTSRSQPRSNAALRQQFGGHASPCQVEQAEVTQAPTRLATASSAPRNPLLEGLEGPPRAGAVRARHLRRLRRPDAPQDLPRALLARLPQAPAGEVRDRRRRPLGLDGRRVPRPDGARRPRVRPRRLPPGRLGRLAEAIALHLARLRRRRAARTTSPGCWTRSTSSAARAGTASTTSPSRRRRCRRSSRSSASAAKPKAGCA